MASKIRNILIYNALKDKEIVNEWSNAKLWSYGINPPTDNSEWIQLFPETYTTYFLPWKAEYNWTDVNKINPTDRPDGVPDGQLCWAATSSNLLYWWFMHNKTYINQFGDKYKGPSYEYPLDKEQESDIFQLYVDSFEDEAGKIDEGLNWFIHGDTPSIPALHIPENHAGYFKEVFPEGVKLAKNYGGLSKENFNNIVKSALKEHKGLGGIFGPVNSSHAMTIWGAEFDEEGFCNYLYVADNNDRDLYESNKVGIVRYGVTYVILDGTSVTQTHYKTNYIENPDASFPISRLVTLELGTNYWDEYFKQQNI